MSAHAPNEKLCEQSCVRKADTRLASPDLHPKSDSLAKLIH